MVGLRTFLSQMFLYSLLLLDNFFSPQFVFGQDLYHMYGILELENVSVPLLQSLGSQSTGTEDL